MNERHKTIDEFWRWFQAHRAECDVLADSDDPFWDIALGQLKRLDSHLCFELSEPDDNDREMIITAQGYVDAFPLVETIVARAPKIPGWRFIALKPPMGFDFFTTYEGIRFEPQAIWFLPLTSKSRPHELGLRIGVPNLTPEIKRQADNAVLVILDTALGERAATLEIRYVEVCALPESPESHGYFPLEDLPRCIELRKRTN